MIKEQIGKRLRNLRHKKGLTQKDLAQAAGVDYTYIGKIERGDQLPSLKVLIRFAECLSLPIDRFFMDETALRLINLIPTDVYATAQKQKAWELIRLLEEITDEDLALLIEIVWVLKKHREMRKTEKEEELPLVAESLAGYKKRIW